MTRMESAACMIDGFGPLPVVRPMSVAELGEIVRRAASKNEAIYPIGGQTQLDLGNPPTKPGVAVDMCGLDQVIDFPARDMTITVQAGITIAKLQALLAPENLQLPIDVPQPERATLGGIIATNVSGPRRLGYGTLRDYVIGISAVNDEGNEFNAGGRVVKNVAGYDMCKLLVGSLGTLGVITQVTLKLRPLAEETALITLGCADDIYGELLGRLHSSRTRPVCLELFNQRAAQLVFHAAQSSCPAMPWTIIIGYEGNADAVNWQVQQLVQELGSSHSLDVCVGARAGQLWRAVIEWKSLASAKFVWKTNTLASEMLFDCKATIPSEDSIQSHAGSGIVYTLSDHEPASKDGVLELLTPPLGSRLVTVKCPREWKSIIPVWGMPPDSARLMHKVKLQFDPRGIFNPGRFVDGI